MSPPDSPAALRRMPAVASVAVMAIAAGLYGCGTSSAQLSANPPTQPTPNYRSIIAKSLKAKDEFKESSESAITYFQTRGGIFSASAKLENVELSDSIRMVQTNYHGWAWQTCLRLNLNNRPVTYAVFISEGRVVDARSALAIDSCDTAHYTPLRGAALR